MFPYLLAAAFLYCLLQLPLHHRNLRTLVIPFLFSAGSWFLWEGYLYRSYFNQSMRVAEVLFLSVLTLAILFCLYQFAKAPKRIFENRNVFLLGAFSLIPYLGHLAFEKSAAPVSYGGYDWHAYALMGKGIQNYIEGKTFIWGEQNPSDLFIFMEQNVFGVYWPIALIHRHLSTHFNLAQAALLSQHLAFFAAIVSLNSFFKSVFRFGTKKTLFIIFLFCINPYTYFVVTEAYLGQIWGLSCFFSALTLARTPQLFTRKNLRILLGVVLSVFGLSIVYSHMLPFLFLCMVAGFWADERKITSVTKKMAILSLGVLLLSPYRFYMNILNTLFLGNLNAGPGMASQHAESWLGIHFSTFFEKAPVILEIAATILFFTWAYRSYKRLSQSNRFLANLPILLITLIVVMMIGMKIKSTDNMNYKLFKAISFFLPILLAYFWDEISHHYKTSRKHLYVGIFLVCINIGNIIMFSQEIQSTGNWILTETAELSKFPDDQRKLRVETKASPHQPFYQYQQMWAGVFLADHELTFSNKGGVFDPTEDPKNSDLTLSIPILSR